MALTTYAELQTAILSRMDRSDLTGPVVDWITISEAEINRWARVNWLETETDLTPSGAFVDLPADFNSMRSLYWNYSNYRVPMDQVSPDMLDKIIPSNLVGFAGYFCIQNNKIEIRPTPSGGGDVTLNYYFKPDALSDSNTSNEILVNAPDLLLYRALAEGYDHIMNLDMSQKYLQMYGGLQKQIMDDSKKRTWDGTPLRVHVDSLYEM